MTGLRLCLVYFCGNTRSVYAVGAHLMLIERLEVSPGASKREISGGAIDLSLYCLSQLLPS